MELAQGDIHSDPSTSVIDTMAQDATLVMAEDRTVLAD